MIEQWFWSYDCGSVNPYPLTRSLVNVNQIKEATKYLSTICEMLGPQCSWPNVVVIGPPMWEEIKKMC